MMQCIKDEIFIMPYAHVHFSCFKQTPLYYVIFFKVKFMNVNTVVAIQTQGRATLYRWVRTYRVEYSRDCVHFNSVLDVDGNNQVRRCHVLYDVFNVAPYYIIVQFYFSGLFRLWIVCCLHLKIDCARGRQWIDICSIFPMQTMLPQDSDNRFLKSYYNQSNVLTIF